MLRASKPAPKPATTKTASSVLKSEKQKSTKNTNAADKSADKKTLQAKKKSDNAVGLSTRPAKAPAASRKIAMTAVHNVTVASPPSSAGKARSTSLINIREHEGERANHSRSRTRTIAPEESVLLQRKLMSASQDGKSAIAVPKPDPVAYEINFDDDKKVKAIVKQKSVNVEKKVSRQKSVVQEKQVKKAVEAAKSVERQKSVIKDQIKPARKPLERQKTTIEAELPLDVIQQPPEDEAQEEEENYESDFESYESDFETEPSEEPSTESEESEANDNNIIERAVQTDKVEKDRIDSGSFDMPSMKKSTPSSAQYDSIDDTVNSHDSGISYDDLNALNKRLLSPKVSEFYKRGQELMKKVTFDEMTVDIFEQKPIPYEVFMSVYGQCGMAQACTQSDSNVAHEETQTECITRASAWTQFPAKFTRIGLEMINSKQYNEEKLGVGVESFDFSENKGDKEELDMSISAINSFADESETYKSSPTVYSTADLNRFIQNASITISNIIEGKSSGSRVLAPSKVPLSRGHLQLKYTEVEALRSTIVTKVYTNLCLSNHLVTVHKSTEDSRSFMALWSVLHTSQPLRIFCAWSDIKCLEIHPQQHDFIVGGCADGSVCLWDIQESTEVAYPCEVVSLNQLQNDFALDNVIALRSIPQRQIKSAASMFSLVHTAQLASLHENGVVSVWTLLPVESVENQRCDMDFIHTGTKVKLVKNLSIDLIKFTRATSDDSSDSRARKKSAFEKTRYYFENDLFSDKVLRELQEIDTGRLQRSQKLALRDDVLTTVSFDVNLNELFVATDSNCIVALSRLCLGDKARKIVTDESASVIRVHPIDGSVLAIGQSNGCVKFVKTSDENSGLKQRRQLKRSYATSASGSGEENAFGKSCAFQNIVEREKKLYEETQALSSLQSVLPASEELQQTRVESDEALREKVRVAFDKNIFNSFDTNAGRVRAIEFSKNGELMFALIGRRLRIFNCWANAEVESHDNQQYIDVKCTHGSDGAEYLILLTAHNEILVNKLKF